MAAWSVGTLEKRTKQLSVVVFVALAISSFAVDSYISKSFSNIFFVYSARAADVIKRDVVDADPSSKGPLIFVAGADICNWVLIKGEFFRLYGGRMRSVECIENTS